MKLIYWIVAGVLALVLIVFAIFYPAGAYYNAKTGTLRLSARFKSKMYPIKDFLGKTEYTKIGPVAFDVDFLTPGVIRYGIFTSKSNQRLTSGEVKYNLADTIQITTPPPPLDNQRASGGSSCGCKH